MKMILKIGCEAILLPDETGVQQLLKLLGRGIHVRDRLYQGVVEIEKQELTIELATVPDATRFVSVGSEDAQAGAEVQPFAAPARRRVNGSARLLLNG